jgi:hypothetical protein
MPNTHTLLDAASFALSCVINQLTKTSSLVPAALTPLSPLVPSSGPPVTGALALRCTRSVLDFLRTTDIWRRLEPKGAREPTQGEDTEREGEGVLERESQDSARENGEERRDAEE